MSERTPSPPASDGNRDSTGRFIAGNKASKGNPLGPMVAKLRSCLLNSVSEADMRAIVAALVEKAKRGDVSAASLLFDRCLGKPLEIDIIERIESLEAQLSEGT